jgi:hypothetical protein
MAEEAEHPFSVLIEIGKPKEIRKPITTDDVQVFSGKTVEKPFYLSVEDGLLEYRVMVEDTPDGIHKHQKEQAEALNQDPPSHPLSPGCETYRVWRLPYRVDSGDICWAEAKTENWGRVEFYKALRDELFEAVREKYSDPYQIVSTHEPLRD